MDIDLHINEASLLDKFPGVRTCTTCARKDSGFNCYNFCKGDRSAYIPVKKLTNGDVMKVAFPELESTALQKTLGADWWNAEYNSN